MAVKVSDPFSNRNDQIANAAEELKTSPQLRKIFELIYSGKRQPKTRDELITWTRYSPVRVSQLVGQLKSAGLIEERNGISTNYFKDPFVNRHRRKILSFAGDPRKLKAFPTKISPKANSQLVKLSFPRKGVDARVTTIDDIDQFIKVREIDGRNLAVRPTDEDKFKAGVKKIIGEKGVFKDWPGELNDVLSSRISLNKKRVFAAFAFKGKGTKGVLFPKSLGVRGDQIQKLFRSPAQLFIVQYWDQIDESVLEMMQHFALAKSAVEGQAVYFGIIDGRDTARLITAYAKSFPRGTIIGARDLGKGQARRFR